MTRAEKTQSYLAVVIRVVPEVSNLGSAIVVAAPL